MKSGRREQRIFLRVASHGRLPLRRHLIRNGRILAHHARTYKNALGRRRAQCDRWMSSP
jgi:hypothetical protein